MDAALDLQAEMLANKIKHYLITMMAVTVDEANIDEFYRAFALTLREEIMINWTATVHTIKRSHARRIHYLCMEYMPGRLTGNNITNINGVPLVRQVMKRLNRNFDEILRREREPGLGNGGLGRLASCLLDSLSTQCYPALGYGLRYQYGIFDQEVWDGVQVERPDPWLLYENPWEFRRDGHGVSVYYCGRSIETTNRKGVEVADIVDYEEVRALAYDIPIIGYKETSDFNVSTLRLWTTKESPKNFQLQRYNAGQIDQASENTSLTDVLYPNDNNETGKRIRLKQEFLLVSASMQDIIRTHLTNYPDMSSFADKVRIQINDTHPALVIAELMRLLIRMHDFSWDEAWETVQICCSYTNHTVLKESLEEWNQNRLQYLLPRQYKIIERINQDFCNAIRKKYPANENKVRSMSIIEAGQVRMAHLAIYGSHRVNGVSELHSEILKKTLFYDFNEMFPEKFTNVTNGVTPRRWILNANPKLANWLCQRIGRGWLTDFPQIIDIAKFANDPQTQQEFLEIKKENKRALIQYLRAGDPVRDARGRVFSHFSALDDEALFDVQVKRFHEYKRQLMNALHVLMTYHELLDDINARKIKRMVVFAGKAAPGYQMAKNIIQLIYCLSRKINNDSKTNSKLQLAFFENYNVTAAELIIPAADLSEQISTAGMEASGTGNMKMAMNGALTICTSDGSNIEIGRSITDKWWLFNFGATADENARRIQYNPWDIYMANPKIRRAVEALKDRSLVETDSEHEALLSIYRSLFEPHNSDPMDRYFVIGDLPAYYDTQKRVEALYEKSSDWITTAIHNIAGMGRFSSDETVHIYAKTVWDLKPAPVDKKELSRVRDDYSEHDKCRILSAAS